ncbi:MAG: hypothetical protein U0935_08005 [Pirellulales bacterium]
MLLAAVGSVGAPAANVGAQETKESAPQSPPAAGPNGAERSTAEARRTRLAAALATPVDAEFFDVPLNDVVAFLNDATGASITFDKRAIESSGISMDTPVTLRAKQKSLRSVLNLLLRETDLIWVVRSGDIRITTVDCSGQLETVVLDVSDLVLPGTDDFRQSKLELIDVIQGHTGSPNPGWVDDGGTGEFDISDDGMLAVTSLGMVVRSVEELVATLRAQRAAVAKGEGKESRPTVTFTQQQGLDAALEEKLKAPATVNFVDAPLSEVCQFIEARYGVDIVFVRRYLDSVGVSLDTSITLRKEDAPLGDILQDILQPLDLAYAVRDEVVLVTTMDSLTHRLRWGVYSVADFLDSRESDDVTATLNGLSNRIIRHCGHPLPGWVDDGGIGRISTLTAAKVLVISTTDDVHESVSRLLKELREKRAARGPLPPLSTKYELRSYRLVQTPGSTPIESQSLFAVLSEILPKETWLHHPKQLGDLIIIEQTPAGHRELVRMVQKLGIPLSSPQALPAHQGKGFGGFLSGGGDMGGSRASGGAGF